MKQDNKVISIHDLDENKHKHIEAESTLVLTCGNASIILHESGHIELKGKSIEINGEGVRLCGRTLRLN